MKKVHDIFNAIGYRHYRKAVAIRGQRRAAWQEHMDKLADISNRGNGDLAEYDAEQERFYGIDYDLNKAYNRELSKAVRYDDLAMRFA